MSGREASQSSGELTRDPGDRNPHRRKQQMTTGDPKEPKRGSGQTDADALKDLLIQRVIEPPLGKAVDEALKAWTTRKPGLLERLEKLAGKEVTIEVRVVEADATLRLRRVRLRVSPHLLSAIDQTGNKSVEVVMQEGLSE